MAQMEILIDHKGLEAIIRIVYLGLAELLRSLMEKIKPDRKIVILLKKIWLRIVHACAESLCDYKINL